MLVGDMRVVLGYDCPYHSRQKRKLIFLESPCFCCCSAAAGSTSMYSAMLVGCEVVFCFDSGVNGIGKRRGGWRGYVGME